MIRHIVAIDEAHGIGKNGGQPWYIPDDEEYFTQKTKSHGGLVLTGKTTFKTFKKPLADRQNYILTHQVETVPGATLVHDVTDFLTNQPSDIWVIGGAAVFAQTIDQADELYITRIYANFGCDKQYPFFENNFVLRSQTEVKRQNGFEYRYEVYGRPSNSVK